MRILILYSGQLGTTKRVAEQLAEEVGADVASTEKKYDVSEYDIVVLGTNIRMGRFNRRFLKALKRTKGKQRFIYIVGAEIERKDYFIARAALDAEDAKIRYVWGELNSEGTKGFTKFALESFVEGRRKDNLPVPRLLQREIIALISDIKDVKNKQK